MLINCPECGKEISDAADKCIHCGFPIEKNFRKKAEEIKKEEANKSNAPRKARLVFDTIQIISIPITAFFVVLFCVELIISGLKPFGNYSISMLSLTFIALITKGIIMIIVSGILKACFKRR